MSRRPWDGRAGDRGGAGASVVSEVSSVPEEQATMVVSDQKQADGKHVCAHRGDRPFSTPLETHGGVGGIRTLETSYPRLHDFQSCSLSQLGHHSAREERSRPSRDYSLRPRRLPADDESPDDERDAGEERARHDQSPYGITGEFTGRKHPKTGGTQDHAPGDGAE